MTITLVVAMDKNRGIGFQNTIPWMGDVPSDMKHFRELTVGHPVIMGKNTYFSIGKALPLRTNIVLSRSDEFSANNILRARSVEEAIIMARKAEGGDHIFVIGGAQIFQDTLPFAERIAITFIDGEFTVDTYFPKIKIDDWIIEKEETIAQNEKDIYSLRFVTLKRKSE